MSEVTQVPVMPVSALNPNKNVKSVRREVNGDMYVLHVRWDDTCKNGHNSLGVTLDIYDRTRLNGEEYIVNTHGKRRWLGSCGCQHASVLYAFRSTRTSSHGTLRQAMDRFTTLPTPCITRSKGI